MRHIRNTLWLALAVFIAAVLAITGYVLARSHTQAIANSLEISAMHARGFEDFLTESLYFAELLASNGLLQEQVQQEQLQQSLPRIEQTLVAILRRAPLLRSMSLQDEHGRIIASSNRANLGLLVATDTYLPVTTRQADLLRLGQPWAGRDFSDGKPSGAGAPVAADAPNFIPVTWPLRSGQGAMTLLVALNTDYFIDHIAQKIDPTEGTVEVLRYDGTLLMGTSASARTGALQPDLVRRLGLNEAESGKFEGAADSPTLNAFQASSRYPLVVLVHLDRGHALQHWQSDAGALLAITLPALLIISLLASAFAYRQSQFTAQRREVKRLQSINATVFDCSAQAIMITDMEGNIISVNAAFSTITGYSAQEAIGRNPRLLASGLQDQPFYQSMWSAVLQYGIWQGELINRHQNGTLYDANLTLAIARDANGKAQHFIANISDISERKLAKREAIEARAREMAIGYNIQQALLMADVPTELNGAWIATYVAPSQGLHGDFVAISQHTPTRFNVLIGDVMGKGIHAAMIGAGVKNVYYQVLAELMSGGGDMPDAAAIVNALHQRITPKLIEMNCFVTLALYVFDAEAETVSIVNAGHTEGLLARAGGQGVERIAGDNLPIGVLLSERYQQHMLSVGIDDQLVIYSDGISEACNAAGSEFGADGVASWLTQSRDANLPSAAALQLLRLRLANLGDGERGADDKTAIIVRLRPLRRMPRLLRSARRNADYLTLPFHLDALPALRGYIEQASAHWPREDAEALLLAAYETATNAVRHTQPTLGNASLCCRITSTDDTLVIELFYLGAPVNVDEDALPDFSGDSDGGFGLYIMRSLLDIIDYSVPAEGMVCVTLVKRSQMKEPASA
jgi:PAS domain S-box-containing protein